MTFDSKSIEKQVEDFLENSFKAENSSKNNKIQKKRFVLLSRLVTDLFSCKNSAVCFQNISNLIILLLNIYKETFPVDIYSNDMGKPIGKCDPTYKEILKEHLL